MIFKHRTLTWITSLLLVLLLAACDGLAGEPQVVATLPPDQADAQKEAISSGAMGQSAAQSATVVAPDTEPDLALGALVFTEHCTRCHGTGGKGDGELVLEGKVPVPLDFTLPATMAGKTPQDYYTIITIGKLDTLMPPWSEKLSDHERWSVANYVYGLSGAVPSATAEPAAAADAATAVQPSATAVEPSATAEAGASQVLGSISGKITNGTADGAVPAGLAVQLHVINQDFSSDNTTDGVAADDGTFQFADVEMKADMGYAVTAEYNGTIFASEVVPGTLDAPALDLPLTIFEATDDVSVVAIDGFSSQVSVTDGELTVIEILSFTNSSDKMYRSTDGTTSVTVTVPEGATLTQFSQQGTRYVYSEDGKQVTDTFPIVPGQSHIFHLLYTMPYNSAGVALTRKLDYPLTNGFEVMIDTPGLNITGDTVAPLGGSASADSPHGSVMSFGNLDPLPAGEAMTYTVSGEPQAAATDSSANSATATTATAAAQSSTPVLAYVFITLGAVAVAGAGFLFYKERQLMRSIGTSASVAPSTSANPAVNAADQARINALVKQIADLDQSHQEGKIKKAVYEKRRSDLKAELMAIIQQSNQN